VKKVILVGGGGHALSLLEMMPDRSMIEGYADMCPIEGMPIRYLGDDDHVLHSFLPEDFKIHIALVFTSKVNLQLRHSLIKKYQQYEFHSFISGNAIVTPNSLIGAGCAIFHRAVVNRAEIGTNTIINTGAIIEHDCKIGNNVFVGPGAVICGGVSVGDNTIIGAGAIIRNGVKVESNSTIGMGSVVVKSIIEEGTYIGNPVTRIK